jgi:hypothetical protein
MMLGALFSSFIKTEDRRLDKARQVEKPFIDLSQIIFWMLLPTGKKAYDHNGLDVSEITSVDKLNFLHFNYLPASVRPKYAHQMAIKQMI